MPKSARTPMRIDDKDNLLDTVKWIRWAWI